MDSNFIEETEVYTINEKDYKVITRVTKECLAKDSLIKLLSKYAMQELKLDDM